MWQCRNTTVQYFGRLKYGCANFAFLGTVNSKRASVGLSSRASSAPLISQSFPSGASLQHAQATRLLSGWGLRFFDYDHDGEVDLILANGHPDDMVAQRSQSVTYREPLLLFQQKNGKFHNVSADAGLAFAKDFFARGLAVGDFDNDGRVDVLIGVNGGAPILLQNQAAANNHWLGIKLQGITCNRDAIGARLVWSAGGKEAFSTKERRGKLSLFS